MNENLLIRGLTIDWDRVSPDSYLHQVEAVRHISQLDFSAPVTILNGENGSGKSTLLEAVAMAAGFSPEGGTRNYSFSTRDSHSELYRALTLIKGTRKVMNGYFLRAESFYNVATMEEEYSRYGGVPKHYHEKSHGESFLAAAQDYFGAGGLYLLDEPEAALSPQRQLTLLLEIEECAKQGAQFIIATHSPVLSAIPDSEILCFDGGYIHPVSYEETDSYRITEMFINHRERFLAELFRDGE